MQLCRNDLSLGGAKTTLKYLRLTINGETKYYNGELKQAEEVLGFSAAFTLDRYGHVTKEMKKARSERMQKLIDRMSI